MEKNQRSLIRKYFNDDLYFELVKVTRSFGLDNNQRSRAVKQLLTKENIPFTALGSGTNRMAVLIDGYAVKIALDADGMIDNRREFLYTQKLQPYVVKVYECIPNGLIAVTEYVSIFTLDDFHNRQDEMREILKEVSVQFLVGDVGITSKNYVNWGVRTTGDICMLDFAYIYDISYKLFICTCDDVSMLQYNQDYTKLVCPTCGKIYPFIEVQKRIKSSDQEKEIGDIRRIGYNITHDNQLVEVNPEFEKYLEDNNKKKKKNKENNDDETEESLNDFCLKMYGKTYKELRKLQK